MTNLKPVDVAIVGGGWTGLAMAKEIVSRSSVSVMALERGAPRGLAEYAMDMDELDYNIRLRMMQNIAEETVTHRHSTRDPAVPVRQYGSFLPGSLMGVYEKMDRIIIQHRPGEVGLHDDPLSAATSSALSAG